MALLRKVENTPQFSTPQFTTSRSSLALASLTGILRTTSGSRNRASDRVSAASPTRLDCTGRPCHVHLLGKELGSSGPNEPRLHK